MCIFRYLRCRVAIIYYFAYRTHTGQSFIIIFLIFLVIYIIFIGILTLLFLSSVLILLSGIFQHWWYFITLFSFGYCIIGRDWGSLIGLFELISRIGIIIIILIKARLISFKIIIIFEYNLLFLFLILNELFPLRLR